MVGAALARDGHAVEEAASVAEALALAPRGPALALLDLGLPDRDGLEAIGPLRAAGAAVIVLTAREQTAEKAAALDLGADDYVTEPFDTDERALRRKLEADPADPRLLRNEPGIGYRMAEPD